MRIRHINQGFWALWVTLVIFCYFNSYDDPSSIFYDKNHAYEQRYSARRAAEGDAYVQRLLNGTATAAKSNSDAVGGLGPTKLCIGIPSVNRPTESFLAHTLATLTDTLTSEQRAALHIVVLLADRDPKSHFAYGERWLAALADEVLVYGDAKDVLPPPEDSNDDSMKQSIYHAIDYNVTRSSNRADRVENMRLDHSVLVERCRSRGPTEAPYFALVEDDIVAARTWYTSFEKGLAYVEKESARRVETAAAAAASEDGQGGAGTGTGTQEQGWIYLRLFYSEIFMGWNSEEWITYAETIFLAYCAVLAIFLGVRMRLRTLQSRRSAGENLDSTTTMELGEAGASPSPPANNNDNKPSTSTTTYMSNLLAAVVLGLWMPALIALYFTAGRVTVNRLIPWPSPPAREMPHYGCCAQGLVFPAAQLEGFQQLLRDPPYQFAGDQILEGYAEGKGLTKWALEPSVFQHVGLKQSSAGPRVAEVWNFSFERLNAR